MLIYSICCQLVLPCVLLPAQLLLLPDPCVLYVYNRAKTLWRRWQQAIDSSNWQSTTDRLKLITIRRLQSLVIKTIMNECRPTCGFDVNRATGSNCCAIAPDSTLIHPSINQWSTHLSLHSSTFPLINILTSYRLVQHSCSPHVSLPPRLLQLRSLPSWRRESEVFPTRLTWTRPVESCLLGMYNSTVLSFLGGSENFDIFFGDAISQWERRKKLSIKIRVQY